MTPMTERIPEDPRVYIALGDSVPAGSGMAEADRYTTLFAKMLMDEGYINRYVNMAEDGLTATMLLDFLRNLDEYDLALFQSAHVMTLNIGGNDILAPLIYYLPTQEDVVDIIFELWDFIQETMAVVPYVMEIARDFQEASEDFSLWRVWQLPGLNRMVQDASPVFSEVTDMFDRVDNLQLVGLLPLLEGSFSPELDAALLSSVEAFAIEFNEIIAWINTHSPDAVIIVNTVYNPVPIEIAGISIEGLSQRAGELIQSINTVILESAEIKGYLVADVYAAFANDPDNMMNFFIDTSTLTFSFDIIHPSIVGHKLIANITYELFIAG